MANHISRVHGTRRSLVAVVAVSCLLMSGCATGSNESPSTEGPTPASATPGVTRSVAPEGQLPAETQTQLMGALETVMQEYGVPGAVAGVWIPGEGTWTAAAGVAEIDGDVPVSTEMTWPIRSITKSYTVTMLLQLADEGKLSLDDPIDQYVEGVTNGDEITLLQLANMSSGNGDYVNQVFIDDFAADQTKVYTLDELNSFAVDLPEQFAPGSKYIYTNANTNLIGAVIEKVTEKPYADAPNERILEPRGQTGTTYITDAADWAEPHPVGYIVGEDGPMAQTETPSILGAAGALFSTLDDGRVWAETLGTGALLEPETQKLRQSGHPIPTPPYDRYAVGMGETNGWLGHNGEGLGFTAATFHNPTTGASIVVYMNESNNPDAHPADQAFRALAAVLEQG